MAQAVVVGVAVVREAATVMVVVLQVLVAREGTEEVTLEGVKWVVTEVRKVGTAGDNSDTVVWGMRGRMAAPSEELAAEEDTTGPR